MHDGDKKSKNWWKDAIDYLSRNAIKLRVRKLIDNELKV